MKILNQKAYGSIPHITCSRLGDGDYHCPQGQSDIALKKPRDKHDLVIVQEKLDGSNVAVAKVDGEIYALGRAGYLASSSKHEQHQLFAKWVDKQVHYFHMLLNEGERLCGEWHLQTHSTRYKLNKSPFVAFDLMRGDERTCYHDFLLRVLPFGIQVPKLLHIGSSFSLENAMAEIAISGHGAIDPVEGIIWRVERKKEVDFLVKYVRPDKIDGLYFPERNNGEVLWNVDIKEFKKSLYEHSRSL